MKPGGCGRSVSHHHIAGNALWLWVAGSAVHLAGGGMSPSLPGYAFVIAQAATVALLA